MFGNFLARGLNWFQCGIFAQQSAAYASEIDRDNRHDWLVYIFAYLCQSLFYFYISIQLDAARCQVTTTARRETVKTTRYLSPQLRSPTAQCFTALEHSSGFKLHGNPVLSRVSFAKRKCSTHGGGSGN